MSIVSASPQTVEETPSSLTKLRKDVAIQPWPQHPCVYQCSLSFYVAGTLPKLKLLIPLFLFPLRDGWVILKMMSAVKLKLLNYNYLNYKCLHILPKLWQLLILHKKVAGQLQYLWFSSRVSLYIILA